MGSEGPASARSGAAQPMEAGSAAGVPGASGGARWFEAVAEHLGAAYLRYSFTYGTEQEVDFLVGALGLGPGSRVLDVGCGPGRHTRAFSRHGCDVLGLDISARFLRVAADGDGRRASTSGDTPGVDGAVQEEPGGDRAGRRDYVRADAAALPVRPGSIDLAVSLCQGGFGLMAGPAGEALSPLATDPDGDVLYGMAAAVRPGGHVVVSAFSSYFQIRYLGDEAHFDAGRGVNHERTEVRSETGEAIGAELWTSCFTPRELRLFAERADLEVVGLWSVTPGDYARRPPDLEHPEFLLVARRPDGS